MTARIWSFLNPETGLFTGLRRSAPTEEFLARNTPAGCVPVEGDYDHLSQRRDLGSGDIVDYQPPAPDHDHEWIHDDPDGNRVRRWVLKPEVAERRARRAAAFIRIDELISKEGRATREHLLGIQPTKADRDAGAMTLREIEDAIAVQRAIIQANS